MTQSGGDKRSERGVVLPPGHTGSSLFYSVLQEALSEFPDVLGAARFPPNAKAWKREYGDALARFEAERAASTRRVDVARFLVRRTQDALLYAGEGGTLPLAEHMAQPIAVPAIETQKLPGSAGLRAEVPLDGKVYRGREVVALAEQLATEQHLTQSVVTALRWIVTHIEERGGALDLSGERFAILGAGAELAPTRMLLQAGASVLWVDVADPARALPEVAMLPGTLVQARTASNLLEAPAEVAAAINAFAADGPVHLCNFAYASGSSREWRLGAAMNAIATHVRPDLIRSIAMLVSPTTTATLQPESAHAAMQRGVAPAAWQKALLSVGLLHKPGFYEAHGVRIARATVSIQGLSYQAAQYISKLASAETFAVHGTDVRSDTPHPITVSANVAGITRTRSLAHPLFQAAFIGAPRFGVRIFDPATTRALSGLLILHDLLCPTAPGAAAVQPSDPRLKASLLLSQQVHGGIYSMPFVLEHAIRAAAVIGMASQPSLLFKR